VGGYLHALHLQALPLRLRLLLPGSLDRLGLRLLCRRDGPRRGRSDGLRHGPAAAAAAAAAASTSAVTAVTTVLVLVLVTMPATTVAVAAVTVPTPARPQVSLPLRVGVAIGGRLEEDLNALPVRTRVCAEESEALAAAKAFCVRDRLRHGAHALLDVVASAQRPHLVRERHYGPETWEPDQTEPGRRGQ
jgi:hypothetical protein